MAPFPCGTGQMPPVARVNVQSPGTRVSLLSSLSGASSSLSSSTALATPVRCSPLRANNAAHAPASPAVRCSPRLASASASPSDDSPSPHKALPNFAARKSDEDSVASGDNSLDWLKESERVVAGFAVQAEAEAAIDEAEEAPVNPQVEEWEVLADMMAAGGDGDEEEAPNPALPPINKERQQQHIETIHITYQSVKHRQLKEIAHELKVASSGSKRVLFDRLRVSTTTTTVEGQDAFEYTRVVDRTAAPMATNVPQWIILTPEEVPPVEGINMATGAEEGFFAPTNKENSFGGKRANFLTAENLDRPEFGPKTASKKRTADGEMVLPHPPVRIDGHPSLACRKLLPPLSEARPKDYFDTQITPTFLEWVVEATNLCAYSSGAGSGHYKDFIPFDLIEIYKLIGVLFANGLAPKPQIDSWFQPVSDEPLFGNDLVSRALAKKNHATKKTISGTNRWKHFRRYLTFSDYRDNPKEKQKEDTMWKIRALVDHLNKNCKDMWVPGMFLAIDEQTIGFQGMSGMKLRISYKREGDGFQCDAVCDKGYTFSFWFRHGPPPKFKPEGKYKNFDLSPTALRVVWLADRLPNRWTRLYMDNLFNSEKLFSALYKAECLAHGVVRTNGRGFPNSIIQREAPTLKLAEATRGTTKAARLSGSAKCPNLLAVSLYDTKPVHILSTASKEVRWIVKQRGVWSAAAQKMAMMKYLRLNVIEEYNMRMNSTDIADQLRGNYRPDLFMRQRKWWWAIFIWAIGVASVNAYRIYCVLWDEENAKKTPGLPKKWSHKEFREQLVYDLIFDGNDVKTVSSSSSGSTSAVKSVTYDLTSNRGIMDYLTDHRVEMITKARLENGYFKYRLNGERHNWLPLSKEQNARCQYCYYTLKNDIPKKLQKAFEDDLAQNRVRVHRCLVCHVNLCPRCDPIFHGVDLSKFTPK